MAERDIFANFERMRREMDELFGGVFDRSLAPHRRAGFTPRVDVSYAGDPPRAIVTAERGRVKTMRRTAETIIGTFAKEENVGKSTEREPV